ncbi:hypothetical protein RJ639_024823 [Escallonia herrerae]|uniref:Uncharacterized protein n=1 Tax=Escallonia herrerae TaxID=1293975 RepID=A0AA88RVL2_9ASTE|nr:hypothetical protein RJ639_024823 [Escallonia herrerae]
MVVRLSRIRVIAVGLYFMPFFLIPGHVQQETCKEEFSDWPHGLLAIGTFGDSSFKDPERCNLEGSQAPVQDHENSTESTIVDEVGELQKDWNQTLDGENSTESSLLDKLETQNPGPERFISMTSSLGFDRSNLETTWDDSAKEDSANQCSTDVVFSRGNDISIGQNNAKNAIRKKSLSFLFNKTFLSKSGLTSPSIRDSVPQSRMEKIFRAILQKKIYPQSSCPKAAVQKYLDSKYMSSSDSEDEMHDRVNDGSKWVKTDSEYRSLRMNSASKLRRGYLEEEEVGGTAMGAKSRALNDYTPIHLQS